MGIDREAIAEFDEDVLLADGLEEAFIGLTVNTHAPARAVYDIDEAIAVLVRRDGMDYDEADEFLQFNTICAFVGERTPIYVRGIGRTPAPEPATPAGDRAAAREPDQSGLARGVIHTDDHLRAEK